MGNSGVTFALWSWARAQAASGSEVHVLHAPIGEPTSDVPFVPNPAEVSEWFEAPLDVFADPARAEIIGDREWRGRKYTLKAYLHEERRIWGATARIMEDLAVRVLGVGAAI